MGTLVFQANLGGAINLIGPNTASTVNFTLPSADGTNGQAMVTNGSGTLSFATISTAAATPTARGTVYASTTSTSTDIVAFGYQAGNSSTGSYSTAIGFKPCLQIAVRITQPLVINLCKILLVVAMWLLVGQFCK